MKSIRRFAYAALLTLSALSLAAAPAGAQEVVHGTFTLPHEVHWKGALVPAGDYEFNLKPEGPTGLLMLRKVSGSGAGFMIVVNDIGPSKGTSPDELLLIPREGGSFVSAMELPHFGVTLHFAVPPETTEKQVAKAAPTAGSSSAQ